MSKKFKKSKRFVTETENMETINDVASMNATVSVPEAIDKIVESVEKNIAENCSTKELEEEKEWEKFQASINEKLEKFKNHEYDFGIGSYSVNIGPVNC